MHESVKYSTPEVNFSITNPNIEEGTAQDTVAPFSFLDFIHNTKVDYTPEEYSSFYTAYIKSWYSQKDTSEAQQAADFRDFYINFIKEVVLDFTTESEKRFLQSIDYNDPVDLDIAIPFYANKIKEIVIFYKNKREEGKYVIERNKIKGSTTGVEKAIFDNIYNFVFGHQDTLQTTNILLDNLEIDIDEYIDVYGDYFDLPRTSSAEADLRRELYTSNLNDINPSFYFDTDVLSLLRVQSFISSIPTFTINVPYTPNACDPADPLNEILNNSIKSSFGTSELYALKRKLISKYCGTNFYYIDASVTPPVSGVLFTADAPTNNLLSIQTADTATVDSNETRLLRDVGLFFTPDKLGLFKIDSENNRYTIDTTKIVTGNRYIFPDPKMYGNVSTNPQENYPVLFQYFYNDDICSNSSGFAIGDPVITNKDKTFTGYNAKERLINLDIANDITYKLNFTDLYNQGAISKVQYDVYGNEYALFKSEPLKQITTKEGSYIKDLILDGHTFFDIYDGYSFDYSLTGLEGGSIRSGLTSLTNGFTGFGSSYYTLYFREFLPYQETQIATRDITAVYRDGAYFTFLDGSLLPDPLSPEDDGYPGNYNYYYNTFLDCNFTSDNSLLTENSYFITTDQAPVSSLETEQAGITASFTYDVRTLLSSGDAHSYDGGYFTDNISLPNDSDYDFNYTYISSTDDRAKTVLDVASSDLTLSQTEKESLTGKFFIKNQRFSNSQLLSTVFDTNFNKYSTAIKTDLYNNIIDFDVIYDILVLQTPTYLVFDKINYHDGQFDIQTKLNTVYSVNSGSQLEKFSNRFFNEDRNRILFTIFKPLTTTSSIANYYSYVPEVHEYNITTTASKKLFPLDSDISLLSSFIPNLSGVSGNNFIPVAIDTPTLTYTQLNDVYKLTYILRDNNNFSHIAEASFTYLNDKFELASVNFYNTNSTLRTTSFGTATQFATISSRSGTYAATNNTLVI